MSKSFVSSQASFGSEEAFQVQGFTQPSIFGRISQSSKFIGCLICSLASVVIQVITIFSYGGETHDESSFALMFSVGIILNFLGAFFLATPMGHLKSLSALGRILPLSLYIILTLMTFLLGVLGLAIIVILALMVVEMITYYWYSISFFSWGKRFIQKNCKSMSF